MIICLLTLPPIRTTIPLPGTTLLSSSSNSPPLILLLLCYRSQDENPLPARDDLISQDTEGCADPDQTFPYLYFISLSKK